MKISIVIPTFNNPTLLRFVLENLMSSGNWPDEVVVVSDFSKTQALDAEVIQKFPVKFIRCDEWQGYAKAANVGTKASSGEIVLLINTDVQFTKPVLDCLKENFAKDDKLAVVGAKLFWPDGRIQHAGAYLDWFGDFGVYGAGETEEEFGQGRTAFYPECVTGAVFAFRRSIYDEIGGFDEVYKFWFEDPEFCYRAWESGYKVFYEPRLEAIHAMGGSRKRETDERFELAKIESKRIWEERKIPRNWNAIFKKVWEANKELYPDYPEQIVLERRGMLGDVIQFTSLVHRVRKAYPKARIYVKTQAQFAPVFKGNQDIQGVAQVIEGRNAHLVTFNVSNEAWLQEPMPWAHWKIAVDAGLEIGEYTKELPVMFSGPRDWATIRDKAGLGEFTNYAVLHQPITHWKSKTLPYETYAKITAGLHAMGLKVVVIGTERDMPAFGSAMDLRGNHTVQEIRELIRHAAVFVGMDSAPANICQTTETPGVVIFTSVRPENILVSPNMVGVVPTGCRGCLHKQPGIVGHIDCPEGLQYECTKTIRPEDVLAEVGKFVNKINQNHINLNQDPSFKAVVKGLVADYSIKEIIETGTYLGTGSTVVFGETGLPVTTIECNPDRAEKARKNLKKFQNVEVVNALTLPHAAMIEHISSEAFKTKEDVYHDTTKGKEVEFYQQEIGFQVPQDALFPLIDNDKNQLILLDSAGGVGMLEVKRVLDLSREKLRKKLVMLDDVNHVKHAESVKYLKGMGYNVQVSQSGRFAWVEFHSGLVKVTSFKVNDRELLEGTPK